MAKAATAQQARALTDIPNVGVATAADLRLLGIVTPADVARMTPLQAYEQLQQLTGQRQDPCVLDVFIAAHRFMNGSAALPWWHFTQERKTILRDTN